MDEALSPRLRRLDRALCQLADTNDPMDLSQLDGFVAGLLVCPDLIMPSEWLPLIWGGDDEPVFDGIADAQQLIAMVMEHYNAVSTALHRKRGRYSPIFDIDVRHDEVLWELWIDGFNTAMQLRAESWDAIALSGGAPSDALLGLTCLIMIDRGEGDLPAEATDALSADAPDLIPLWIETLAAWRLEHSGYTKGPPVPKTKTGRNDPCPCGSGKKYKKCCGLN